ncbi:MAG: hypothetical protein HYW05_02885 [Candidatus Diapherotrites archaeon]|nr:hypothetical protein [Candidatus Diapherotrites archaeon]
MGEEQNNSQAENKGAKGAEKKDSKLLMKFSYALIGIVAALMLFNQYMLFNISGGVSGSGTGYSGIAVSGSYENAIPSGVPAVYGAELQVRYDDISTNDVAKSNATIAKMSVYDTGITLSGEKLQRYIAVTTQISCEYCCGADAITFSNGAAACACAHSGAMRGLAKYLLDRHAGEFTNDQILEELGKWKTLFFPGIMQGKANVLKQKGIEFNYINLASNKYRGIEKA